jgi:hypothetical protein
MWGEVYEPMVDDQWPHNPIFVKNTIKPFSIIPKANNYRFLTKKYGRETYVGRGVRSSVR